MNVTCKAPPPAYCRHRTTQVGAESNSRFANFSEVWQDTALQEPVEGALMVGEQDHSTSAVDLHVFTELTV